MPETIEGIATFTNQLRIGERVDYYFPGTDGRDCLFGPSPASFIRKVVEEDELKKPLSRELLDSWFYIHVKHVAGQTDLSFEEFRDLYYEVDFANLATMLIGRITEGILATKQGLENISNKVADAISLLETEVPTDGLNERPSEAV
jgi:hypothetical protein